MKDGISPEEKSRLLEALQARFEKHAYRHPGVSWEQVQARLYAHPGKFRSLQAMEESGGEPDVVGVDPKTGTLTFMDCVAESPKGRRSTCDDEEARLSRKEYPPERSALGMAADMGVELLGETQYRQLQELEPLDRKTSSWLLTPPEIRRLGGAIFGDRRYNQVFIYHNGADSYYAARGFRAFVKI